MKALETNIEAPLNYYVTDHFMYSDFLCPCCDRIKIVPGMYRHIALLDRMAGDFGDIIVTSGYRCEAHNREVGGSPRSWHMLFATDITVDGADRDTLNELYKLAIDLDFGGIGLYESHLHLDIRPEKVRWRV